MPQSRARSYPWASLGVAPKQKKNDLNQFFIGSFPMFWYKLHLCRISVLVLKKLNISKNYVRKNQKAIKHQRIVLFYFCFGTVIGSALSLIIALHSKMLEGLGTIWYKASTIPTDCTIAGRSIALKPHYISL